MRSRIFAGISLAGFVVVSCLVAYSQESRVQWHTVTSNAADFSAALPVNYIVHKDGRSGSVKLVGLAGRTSYELTFNNTTRGLAWPGKSDTPRTEKGERTQYVVEGARVSLYTYQGASTYRISVSIAAKKGIYRIGLLGPSADDTDLASILASIKLNGRAVVNGSKVPEPSTAATIKAGSLESSEIVKAALKRRQSERFETVVVSKPLEPEEDEVIYSRRLMVLYKVAATYSEQARKDMIQGTVRVRILFKANGNIGRVTIIKGLPSGLNDEVLRAIKLIKFLPAEVNGVPADAEKELEYTFGIY